MGARGRGDAPAGRRQGRPGANTVLDDGIMHFGAYEIPVLDNDPNYPDRGMLRLTMEGGV